MHVLTTTRSLVPALCAENSRMLAQHVASFMTVELSTYSLIPSGLQPLRRKLADECFVLLQEVIDINPKGPAEEKVLAELRDFQQLLRLLGNPPSGQQPISSQGYKWNLETHSNLSRSAA